jgi:hypothetical protein
MPKRNRALDELIERMVDQHADFIRSYGTLIRRAYDLGRSDERLGIRFDEDGFPKQLTEGKE